MSLNLDEMFRLDVSALVLIVRTSIIYLGLLIALRVITRREMGSFELPDLLLLVLIVLVQIWAIRQLVIDNHTALAITAVILAPLALIFVASGFYMLQPNQAAAITLFGDYKGTDRSTGLRWVLPWMMRKKVSVRAHNFISDKIKVNDLRGNPIEMAAQIVWRVVDTAQALFDVDDYKEFVRVQVEDQLPAGTGFEAGAPGPIPAVISGDLIDMYNTGFAKANDLPQLTPEILRNRSATLILGSSSFNPRAGGSARPLAVRLIGVSDRVPLVGISVPLEIVNRWNAELAGERSAEYVQLTVVAGRAEEVDRIAGRIEAMGYTVTTGREIAERVRTLTDVLRAAFGTIGLVVLTVAGIGIGNALLLSVMERRHEIGIFRSVGASRGDIRLLFLVEAGLIGLLGAVTGVILAFGAARVADLLLDRVLPELPLLPQSFFALSWPILLAGLTLGVLVSVLAAVPPAHRAARLDPARTLETG